MLLSLGPDMPRRTAIFTTLASLAPPVGPDREKILAWAEIEAGLWHGEGNHLLTPALIQLLAHEVEALAQATVAQVAGRTGYAVFDVEGLAAELGGNRSVACLLLRLAGAHCDSKGRWSDQEYADANPVPIPFPPGFIVDFLTDLGEAFAAPDITADD